MFSPFMSQGRKRTRQAGSPAARGDPAPLFAHEVMHVIRSGHRAPPRRRGGGYVRGHAVALGFVGSLRLTGLASCWTQ